jgi:hypothetical protein
MGKKKSNIGRETEVWVDGYRAGLADAEYMVSHKWMTMVGGLSVTQQWMDKAPMYDLIAVLTLRDMQREFAGKRLDTWD